MLEFSNRENIMHKLEKPCLVCGKIDHSDSELTFCAQFLPFLGKKSLIDYTICERHQIKEPCSMCESKT